MITPGKIAPLRGAAPDRVEAVRLIKHFATLRRDRTPLYLTRRDLDRVLRWKLRRQYGRQTSRRVANTEAIIRVVTRAAFEVKHDDPDYETELRLSVLCCLRGVGVRVASAILTVVRPDRYGVIDFRGWRQFFSGRKITFTPADYLLSFAKTASDSAGEDPWATGGLGTRDDRRADGPPLYRKAVGIATAIGPGQKDVIVRAGRMTVETTNSSRGSTLVAGRGPVDAGLCCPADVAMM